MLISQHVDQWIDFITRTCAELVIERGTDADPVVVAEEMSALRRYLDAKWRGVLNASGDLTDVVEPFTYDVLQWRHDEEGRTLAEFRVRVPVNYRFFFTAIQLKQRDEDMRRFGYDGRGIAKLYARGMSYDPFRHIENVGSADASPAAVGAQLT